jgi:hypothetical protein
MIGNKSLKKIEELAKEREDAIIMVPNLEPRLFYMMICDFQK